MRVSNEEYVGIKLLQAYEYVNLRKQMKANKIAIPVTDTIVLNRP